MKKSYEMDMCNGPILGKVLVYAFPLMLSGILQLLFNAADVVIVGRYAGSQSLAAVGSTSALINLLINVFIGLSVGVNVLVAQYYGAKNEKEVNETVHTAIAISLISGVFLIFLGMMVSRPLLELMGTPNDVIEKSTMYMQFYFAGMPVIMLYNFGSAVLRAVGDTRRPLYFLTIAGVVNVVLNYIFVTQFNMDVAGVALATVLSQVISAGLVIKVLMQSEGCLKLELKKLKIHKSKLKRIVRVGLPAGMQGAIFSISNVLIQSSVNSFGSIAMAGNTTAQNIEGFIYASTNCFYHAAITFTGQHIGAGKYKRISKILLSCIGCAFVVCAIFSVCVCVFAKPLAGVYSTDLQVIEVTVTRLLIVCSCYVFCSVMDVIPGIIRGMGYSITPTVITLTGACFVRIVWVATIFQYFKSLKMLLVVYPISWGLTIVAHLIFFSIVNKKLCSHKVTNL